MRLALSKSVQEEASRAPVEGSIAAESSLLLGTHIFKDY
jgi:hypothetical protein